MNSLLSLMIAAATLSLGPMQKAELRAYTYIAPAAKPSLETLGLSDEQIIQFVNAGLIARDIQPIDPNRVYEGSEDSLRIDIRKRKGSFVIELSVRQGASIHNMLQRWVSREAIKIRPEASASENEKQLLSLLNQMLDRLKRSSSTKKYLMGEMVEP